MAERAPGGGDEFESKYMAGGERVLHRDKRVTRGMAAIVAAPGLFTIALAIFVAVVNPSADKPLPAVALPAVVAAMVVFGLGFLVLAATLAVMRVVVTDRALHIKYGLWGPTIALDSIRKVRVVDYDWTMYGGWGMRRGRDGSWAYVAQSGPVVEITYDDSGSERRVLVSASSPTELVERLQHARASGAAQGSGRQRIARPQAAHELDAEMEAHAEEAHAEEAHAEEAHADRARS